MTIQDIIKQLQKDPQVAKKYNEKYLHSVLEEQLFLLDYKKTFEKELKENSIDDEEEIELDPEEIPIEEPKDIVIPEEEPEIDSPEQELDDKPALETEPKDEPEPEIQQRPEDDNGEVELEPDQLPAPTKDIPLQNQDKISTKEAEADGYIRISPQDARELLSYKGKMFTAIFIKRSDGSLRSLNGMTGVRKYTVGGELPYSPKEKELIPVYDLKLGPGRQGYRTIPLEGLKALKINGKKYKIDQALVKEIIIDKPKRIWNFIKYMPNFNPENIKKDDVIRMEDRKGSKKFWDFKVISVSDGEIEVGFDRTTFDWGFNLLKKWNNENKPDLQEITINTLNKNKLQEVGTLQQTQYNQSQDEEYNIQNIDFEVDGRKVELRLSLNPSTFKDELNIIFVNQTIPKNVGEVGFTIDGKYNTIKSRNKQVEEKPTKEELERKLQNLENNSIIRQGKRLGYRGISTYKQDRNVEDLVNKNFQIFRSYDNIKQQLSNYQQPKQETPQTKEYITILNKVSYVIKDLLEKYKFDLLIINKPGMVNNETITKRNNIYTQLIKKYIPSGYKVREKNQILYIQKENTIKENMNNPKKGRRFIPTSIKFEKSLRNIFQEHFRLMKSSNEDYKLYISPMMKVSLESIQRGRTSMDTRSKQSSLTKLIQEKLPNDIRSILKNFSPKINQSINMYPINSKIEKIENGDIYFYNPFNPQTSEKAYDNIISENPMKKNTLKQLVKEVLTDIRQLKEEDEKPKRKTSFNFKSTFEDLVIKINTSNPQDFNSLKQEWLTRLESSKINPATNKKMVSDVKAIPNHSALIRYANNALLKYEKLGLNENQPAPQRQAPDREVIEKPDVDTPERKPKRRTLTPPTERPETRPKAEGVEKELAGKMASRFSKLKQGTLNEGPTKDRAIKIILGKSDKYTKEELSSKSDQELAKIIQGLMKGA